MWINFDSVTTLGGLIAEGREVAGDSIASLFLNPATSKVRGSFSDTTLSNDPTVVSNGVWVHFCWVYDDDTTTLKLYRDGTEIDSDTPANARDLTATRAITGYSSTTAAIINNAARANEASRHQPPR